MQFNVVTKLNMFIAISSINYCVFVYVFLFRQNTSAACYLLLLLLFCVATRSHSFLSFTINYCSCLPKRILAIDYMFHQHRLCFYISHFSGSKIVNYFVFMFFIVFNVLIEMAIGGSMKCNVPENWIYRNDSLWQRTFEIMNI